MISNDDILIVLPSYNEATAISVVIEDIITAGFENIVVVNDGSQDETSLLLKSKNIKELSLPLNRGVGAAIKTGLLYARSTNTQFIILIDADGQHYPEDIRLLVNEMISSSSDMVIGSRFLDQKSSVPRRRKLYNRIANVLTLFGRIRVSDSQSGFRLLNRSAIENINLEIDGYGVCTEMIWKCKKNNLKISETPIRVRYTDYSMSKGQNFFKGIQTGISLIKNI